MAAWEVEKNENGAREEAPVALHFVEKILGKRALQKVPHYLARWEGYDKMEDRTWPPCEELMEDVPQLVEAFEEKRRKKK